MGVVLALTVGGNAETLGRTAPWLTTLEFGALITIALIMMGALVNFLSRQTLSIAAPTVIADLHITTQQYGWITSAFQGGIILPAQRLDHVWLIVSVRAPSSGALYALEVWAMPMPAACHASHPRWCRRCRPPRSPRW